MTTGVVRALSPAQESAYLARTVPPAEQIREGIGVIPLPIVGGSQPFSLCYAVEDDRGAVHLIDSGIDSNDAWRTLESGLAALGHGIDDVASLTATHLHHDHAGLAVRLRGAAGAELRMHERDTHVRSWSRAELDDLLVEWEVPPPMRAQLAPALDHVARRGNGIRVDHVIADGDLLDIPGREARVIATPGHTDGSCCVLFADEGLLLLGDHLLPTIFPGIGLGGKAVSGNAILDYLRSLDVILPYAAAEGLPGHGYRFSGVAERIATTREHHLARNTEIADAFAASGGSVWEVASSVRWSTGWAGLPVIQRFSALMQTSLHLDAAQRLSR